MPRRNRVDPWGDLRAVAGRGLLTGNRGCVVDDDQQVVRHHHGRLWITCTLEYRGRRHPLAAPHRWTPLFLLDDAVALAAGHRPCARCRREPYREYRAAVGLALRRPDPLGAGDLDARLASERLRRGRGLDRAGDRLTWTAPARDLPDGTVVVREGAARLLLGDRSLAFGSDGWHAPAARPAGDVVVLTPPTSVLALGNGFAPLLHPSALAGS
ncbi:hypothetical protein GCM10028777_07010 [Angustibacter speluncae]